MRKKEETYGYSREHLLAFICADPRDITTVEKICKFIYITFFFFFLRRYMCNIWLWSGQCFLPSAILFIKGKVVWDFGMGGGGMGLQPDPSNSLPSSSYPGRQEQLYAPFKLMHVEFLWQGLGFCSHSLISVKKCGDGFQKTG